MGRFRGKKRRHQPNEHSGRKRDLDKIFFKGGEGEENPTAINSTFFFEGGDEVVVLCGKRKISIVSRGVPGTKFSLTSCSHTNFFFLLLWWELAQVGVGWWRMKIKFFPIK